MKHALTVALLFLASCVTTIKTDAILDTIQAVVIRHDAYVMADDQDPVALAQSAELMDLVLSSEEVEKQTLAMPLLPVTARHDVYVNSDESLTPLEKRVYLRSSSELRHLVE